MSSNISATRLSVRTRRGWAPVRSEVERSEVERSVSPIEGRHVREELICRRGCWENVGACQDFRRVPEDQGPVDHYEHNKQKIGRAHV